MESWRGLSEKGTFWIFGGTSEKQQILDFHGTQKDRTIRKNETFKQKKTNSDFGGVQKTGHS